MKIIFNQSIFISIVIFLSFGCTVSEITQKTKDGFVKSKSYLTEKSKFAKTMQMITPFTDEYFMKQAYLEAKKAFDQDEVPVGAVIVVNNQIIARAHNLTEKLHDVTAHAEVQAITAASEYLGAKYLTNCTMYVTLEPCQMCAGALYWSQISRVVFGASDEKRGYRTMGTTLHPSTEVTQGVFAKESADLLTQFFHLKRLQ